MRSRMLGLAVALTTFGLGVSATTAWIAYHTPKVPVQAQVTIRKTAVSDAGSTANDPGEVEMITCEDVKPLVDARSTTIAGGVLNGKAIIKPAPAYPAIARAVGVSGTVVVQVKIDECGNVVAAQAVSGHPLLRQAAVDAAYKWQFSQTILLRQPVKVSGTVTFNFLLQ